MGKKTFSVTLLNHSTKKFFKAEGNQCISQPTDVDYRKR